MSIDEILREERRRRTRPYRFWARRMMRNVFDGFFWAIGFIGGLLLLAWWLP